jgi:hypothetical protein
MLLHNKNSKYFLLNEILACYSALVVANHKLKLGEIQS